MDTKTEIIQAAFELFCEKGYYLSVSELARAVGIKTPSLYSHYEGKDQIIELMICEEIHRYFSCLEDKMNQSQHLNCKETLKYLYHFILEYFSSHKRLRFWRSIPLIPSESLKRTCSRLIAEKDALYHSLLKQRFMKAIETGEIRPDVSDSALYLFLCMIQGVLDGMLLYPKGLGENSFSMAVFDAYWKGISVGDQ